MAEISQELQLTDEVTCSFLPGHDQLPLVYTASSPKLKVAEWYRNNELAIKKDLLTYGGILFRGFDVTELQDFENVASEAIKASAEYVEGATPRTMLTKSVYTSTEFPPNEEIALHNELSYVVSPPSLVAFCCLVSAETGGQTQIVDVNRVLNTIPLHITNEFRDKGGWKLQRNFGLGLGPTAKKAFGTTDLSEIRAYCQQANINMDLAEDDHIRISQVRDAIHRHPVSGVELWFNHVSFWHPSSLPEDYLEEISFAFDRSDFPFSTYYGNGEDIPDDYVKQITKAYKDVEVVFDWQEGDVMLLDNWRVAHGRKPFTGERKVYVSMGY